ncbi:hypothetical protein F5879DRAFT_880171 [Lentinula edodes]|uniref:uncharacterized protein n=1 Tax=Lentinula edodes TaxID=5353 RepID=UPI001BFA4066|nr:uncharacterized protein C8R40DRAFT_1154360 [Lentinula edodes]KAF8829652.1 hypothetical protein HHX47_DHR3001221 [Lentinula edodes]KAH7870050.1 hypothetical protein C8R40DRAFT_1154360 [Lentinula edodes]KAJ3904726.1 hypothetical protein F5879DRAFT_880171 [Lentinula edodes]
MFRSLAQLGAKGNSTEKKSISPTLRSDIYTTIDQYKAWLAGTRGQAGDGVSYAPMLHTIQKHFPNVAIGLEALGQIEAEVGVIVGGITNMVLEMSKWEALGGGMAMRTWVDTIVNVYAMIPHGSKKEIIARGIVRGINQHTDYSLMTKEFAARIQIISCLKSLCLKIYGPGSEESRQAEAMLSSKLI